MPNVKYNITLNLNTEKDIDLIQFMDQYSETGTILKSIIRFYIARNNESARIEDRLDSIEDIMHSLKKQIDNMRDFTILPKDDTINTNSAILAEQDKKEIENNISSIFEE